MNIIQRSLFTAAAACLFSSFAFAQEPAAPTNLKVEQTGTGIRLSWTAPAGTGNTYLIERSGPGLSLFTPIAGPISETNYFLDQKAIGDPSVRYSYRVRTVNLGPATPAVAPSSTDIRNLPLVGSNIYDLLAVLPGYRSVAYAPNMDENSRRLSPLTAPAESISFMLKGATGRTVAFESANGSFSWGCPSCEFSVSATGVGFTARGISFKLSTDGSQLQLTCHAKSCEVLTARTLETTNNVVHASGDVRPSRLAVNESMTLPSSQRALLTIDEK